jgi:hypothetical protein
MSASKKHADRRAGRCCLAVVALALSIQQVALRAAVGGEAAPGSSSEAVALAAALAAAQPADHQPALAAQADRLALIRSEWVLPCLAAFGQATPGGANWVRSGLDRAVERLGAELSDDTLAEFVLDRSRPARARSLAFAWLRERDADRAAQLSDGFLDDPALDLRREAVERLLAAAPRDDEAAVAKAHRRALSAARDIDQIERIAGWLKEHGEAVDLPAVFGFVRRWRLSQTFDNVGGRGFARAYPPEAGDPGVIDTRTWKEVRSQDSHGIVDLNAEIEQKKGVLAYAVAEVDMPHAGAAEVRIGSPCALAVWVNGKPVMAHEIYHASEAIDQYVAAAEFRAGTNVVMVKCCQNEQTEAWAADWKFQLRICDPLGTPLGSQPE